ncbi:TPA: hypothetical protein PP853_002800, partial [Staphylococcus aureus]|nr:hypothetical protein [Staphylococcus aureus]
MSNKIKFVEDDPKSMEALQKFLWSGLPVYLTYGQLNGHIDCYTLDYKYKLKTYNNGTLKVIKYKNTRQKSNISIHQNLSLHSVKENNLILSEEERKNLEEENRKSYMFKVRTKIKDLVLNNHFDMFWTLTFDPKKCDEAIEDEYRFEEMHKWLNKMRKRHNRKSDKPFNYIAIPERHKSGLIHWHMVTGNLEPTLVDSGKTYQKQKIYNCADWQHGFSNVQMMRSKSKISSYVTKYITKDLLNTPARKNKRKYWSSNNLTLPNVYGVSDDSVLDFMRDEYDKQIKPDY